VQQGKQENIRTLGYGEENGQLVLVDRFELEAWEKKVQSLMLLAATPLWQLPNSKRLFLFSV